MGSEALYIYALAAADAGDDTGWRDALPEVPGAGPAELRCEGQVAALCSPWRGAPPDVGPALAAAHAAAVEAAASRLPLLPCAAGAVLPAGDLGAWLRRRQVGILAALRRVAGRVEFGLKVWDRQPGRDGEAPAPAVAGGPGRAYLGRLRAREAARGERREAARGRAAPLLGALLPLAAEVRCEWGPDPCLLLRAALLVPATELATLRKAFAQALPTLPSELECLLSGPWAPYHFAEVEEWS